MTPHTCNKEHEIDGLSKKVDGIYKTINGNGEGVGMKVQLAMEFRLGVLIIHNGKFVKSD